MSVLFSRPPYHRVRDHTNSAYHTLPLRYLQSLQGRGICKCVEPRPALGKPHRLESGCNVSSAVSFASKQTAYYKGRPTKCLARREPLDYTAPRLAGVLPFTLALHRTLGRTILEGGSAGFLIRPNAGRYLPACSMNQIGGSATRAGRPAF